MTLHRILLIEINQDGTVGGSHRALFDLVRRLDRRRFEPVVAFYQANRYVRKLEALGVVSHVWSRAAPRGRGSSPKLRLPGRAVEAATRVLHCRQFLRRERISLVHLNNAPTVNFEDWLPASRLLGIPCISHARGAETLRPGGLGRFLMRRFDSVLAVSEHIARSLEKTGVPPRILETVHDGIDLEDFRGRVHRDAVEVRSELGVKPQEVLAVMVGHLRAWKGQSVVLEALRCLEPEDLGRLRVAFVGGAADTREATDYREALMATAAEEGLGDRVSFLGDRGDVPDLMNASDLVLHASTVPEPFGLVILEGMALGKPVIASRLGGPSEIFSENGVDGVTFDPGSPRELAEKIAELVNDPDRRRAIGAKGEERVHTFAIAKTVSKVEEVYRRLLQIP